MRYPLSDDDIQLSNDNMNKYFDTLSWRGLVYIKESRFKAILIAKKEILT
jgi:hypothetical protein